MTYVRGEGLAVGLSTREKLVPGRGWPDDVDAAFGWQRPGSPQLHHTHFFLTRLRVVLRDQFPDVLEALYEAGGTNQLIIGPGLAGVGPAADQDGPEDLRLLAMRRTTFEWVLRGKTLEQEGVEIRTGTPAVGLATGTHEGKVAVAGVELTDGTTLDADTVIATTGRSGEVSDWLGAHGVSIREQVGASPNIVYFTRFYQLATGKQFPTTGTAPGRGRAGVFCGVSPADNGTYSLIVAVDSGDSEMRSHLQDPTSFEAIARLFPETGDPILEGLHCLGDAHTVSNPLYGRGCTLAAIQAVELAEAFSNHPGNPGARARAYGQANSRLVEPWYHLAVEMDRLRQRKPSDNPDSPAAQWPLAEIMAAATSDSEVGMAWARVAVMLDEPGALFDNPDLTARAAAASALQSQSTKARPTSTRTQLSRADLLQAAQQSAG